MWGNGLRSLLYQFFCYMLHQSLACWVECIDKYMESKHLGFVFVILTPKNLLVFFLIKKRLDFLFPIAFNSNAMTFSIAIFFFFSLLYLLSHLMPKSMKSIIHAHSVFPVLYDIYIDNISVINAIIANISHKFFLSIKSCYYLNKSECEPVLTSDNTKTSSIFSYINKKSGSIWHSRVPL